MDVLQVLSHLQRETGQVERAIQIHQALLARPDLSRAERAHALASLGADFRQAGFLDRADQAFEEALAFDPNNIYALTGQRKVHEDQRHWREAYEVQTRLSRLRKADDGWCSATCRPRWGRSRPGGRGRRAEAAFKAALALDRRVFPAVPRPRRPSLRAEPARAVALLEDAQRATPERAYLAFDRLERAYAAMGEPERFADLCERLIRQDPRDLAGAPGPRPPPARPGAPRRGGRAPAARLRVEPPFGPACTSRCCEPCAPWARSGPVAARLPRRAESAVFYADPHVCTACRYRADGMLWRCPHCHEWNTFVEERVGPTAAGS